MGLNKSIVKQQADAGMCVKIGYESERQGLKVRTVEPYSYRMKMAWFRGVRVEAEFLLAWDIEDNDHIRSYRVVAITSTASSDVPSKNRFDVEI